jgi:hypothetical protein
MYVNFFEILARLRIEGQLDSARNAIVVRIILIFDEKRVLAHAELL